MARYAVSSTTTVVASPAGGSETIIATTGPINLILDSAPVFLFWYFAISLAASTTGLWTILRRGTTVGATQVNANVQETAAASSTVRKSGCFVDTIVGGAGLQYSLSVICTGAAGASTVNELCMLAVVL